MVENNNPDFSFGLEWAHELEEGMIPFLGNELTCMEIIPENFLEGRFGHFLSTLREKNVPVAVHGVLMSIGSMEPLKEDHFNKLLEVGAQIDMRNFSDHLSLTDVGGIDLDALTPLAWTKEVAEVICQKIEKIQDKLKVPFLIENVSNRFVVPDCEFTETQFINEILTRTGCGLLLDVTNVYTNSVNFKFDPYQWLDEVNLSRVQTIHLAGGFWDPDKFLMDSHDNQVPEEAWDLYRYIAPKLNPCMTIIERTGNFPNVKDLVTELNIAKKIIAEERNTPLQQERMIHVSA